jgi:hypothetical protein
VHRDSVRFAVHRAPLSTHARGPVWVDVIGDRTWEGSFSVLLGPLFFSQSNLSLMYHFIQASVSHSYRLWAVGLSGPPRGLVVRNSDRYKI